MALIKWRTVVFICAATLLGNIWASQKIMAKISKGFSTVLDICVSELEINENVYKDFKNFWRDDYELLNRDLGCVIMCMASKLDLVNDDEKLHHGQAHAFAMKHGADDEMAKQLVTMLHDCESIQATMEDSCVQVLEITKCFRAKIHELKWAPSIEVLLEEVMSDV